MFVCAKFSFFMSLVPGVVLRTVDLILTAEGWCYTIYSASVNLPHHRIFNFQKKEIESSTFRQYDEFKAVSGDLEVSSGVYSFFSDGRNCSKDENNSTSVAQSKTQRWHWLRY
jgi:hypothetical protein